MSETTVVSISLQTSSGQAGGTLIVTNAENATLVIALLALLSLAIAAVLLTLNRWLVRFLEGYYRPISWLQPLAKRRYKCLRCKLKEVSQIREEERQKGEVSEKTRREYRRLTGVLAMRYPDHEDFILATSFGNSIRAAETYSRVMYGADVIPMWPRLLSVVDADFRRLLEGARAVHDCAVNILYVWVALAVETAVAFGISDSSRGLWKAYWYAVPVLVLAIVLTYQIAVSSAVQWGNFIRATCDLYLDTLFERLRLKTPGSEKERREIWQSVSRSFLYLESLSHVKKPPD